MIWFVFFFLHLSWSKRSAPKQIKLLAENSIPLPIEPELLNYSVECPGIDQTGTGTHNLDNEEHECTVVIPPLPITEAGNYKILFRHDKKIKKAIKFSIIGMNLYFRFSLLI
jgi:hypothetical protein